MPGPNKRQLRKSRKEIKIREYKEAKATYKSAKKVAKATGGEKPMNPQSRKSYVKAAKTKGKFVYQKGLKRQQEKGKSTFSKPKM